MKTDLIHALTSRFEPKAKTAPEVTEHPMQAYSPSAWKISSIGLGSQHAVDDRRWPRCDVNAGMGRKSIAKSQTLVLAVTSGHKCLEIAVDSRV
jgi:hypothetical protein